MSIEVVLVPLALAAFSAWQASRLETVEGRTACQVATRMRDEGLLTQALSDTSAATHRDGDRLVADWQGVQAVFTRGADGVLQVHFTGDIDEARAVAIVTAIDHAYTRRLQLAVVERIRERAPAAGMSIASETVEEDDSVVLVLNVGNA